MIASWSESMRMRRKKLKWKNEEKEKKRDERICAKMRRTRVV